jgi:Alpha/beta hydrolase domain
MHVFVSGAGMLPIMQSGTGPQSSATGSPSFENPEFRGVHEDVLTIGEIIKRVKARGETPPRMIMINSTTDYFSLRASLARTGAEGMTELPFPDNVRVYDIAGASHVVLQKANCELPLARLDWSPVSRDAAAPRRLGSERERTAKKPADAACGSKGRPDSAACTQSSAQSDHRDSDAR